MKEDLDKVPEILAPIQNWKTLKFIDNLPDAIYFGVQNYNMRKKADNFTIDDLGKITKFCHEQKNPIKAYLCTNIVIYNNELDELECIIKRAKDAKIDAIIAHDIAAINLSRKYNIPFHISTQANISNIESAQFYEDLAAERINLARELSLKQIIDIKKQLNKSEIECFVHGSMCTSISGRCYFSAEICKSQEFSANRGNCVQPCRRKWTVIDDQANKFIYDGKMFLNAKDLCMIEYIPQLMEAEIDAFKIEGRMKDPLYVKTVVQTYKKAIESYYNNTFTLKKAKKWKERLSEVFNRGFHTGFYFNTPTIEDIEMEYRGNISKYRRKYIGKVLSYKRDEKIANVIIEAIDERISKEDPIIIESHNSFYTDKIHTLAFQGTRYDSIIRKNSDDPLSINITLKKVIEKNAKIYKLIKREKINIEVN
ncbi:MAG: U32 family peptidase [Candidatus Lokiarchaeota archaeon]|nr:U32 family peptidase [Candidatus Lokiarchaeota archaeon]MBD3199813.1 U32 family peptidase [Candidatus Lokiarchaeota archaeon]